MNRYKRFEDAMLAATRAAARETSWARNRAKDKKTGHKKVLLGIDNLQINQEVLQHALSLCRRLGSSMEIFHFLSADPGGAEWSDASYGEALAELNDLREKLHQWGISYHYVIKDTSLVEELLTTVSTRRDIATLLISESGANGARAHPDMLARVKCPVVILAPATKKKQLSRQGEL